MRGVERRTAAVQHRCWVPGRASLEPNAIYATIQSSVALLIYAWGVKRDTIHMFIP